MLTTGALRAICVDAEVVLVDLYLGLVPEIGDDDYSGKGRVASGLGVERADPDQPVDSSLGFQRPVGPVAFDRESG